MSIAWKLADKEILIDRELDEFNSIYKIFRELSWEQVREFIKVIYEIDDLDTIMENMEELTTQFIFSCVDAAIEVLTKFDIWSISREQFISEFYADYFPFLDLYKEYAKEYEKILNKAEQQKLYREYQRSSRGYWEGGGFGLSGAIRGAINAGILNAVTGTFRFIGDSVVNVVDNYHIYSDKKQLHNSEFLQNYAMDLRQMCENVGFALYTKLQQFGLVKSVHFKPEEVTAILSNIENHTISREKKIDMMIYCIKRFPYNFDIYKHLFSIFGTNNLEIAKIANYFGFKYEIEMYFLNLISSQLETVLNMPENTPIQCKHKKDSIIKLLKQYNLLNDDLKSNKDVVNAFNILDFHNEIIDKVNKLKKNHCT